MIKIDQRQLNQADVLALYQAVGWNMYTRDPKKLERAIAQLAMVRRFYLFRIYSFCPVINGRGSGGNW